MMSVKIRSVLLIRVMPHMNTILNVATRTFRRLYYKFIMRGLGTSLMTESVNLHKAFIEAAYNVRG